MQGRRSRRSPAAARAHCGSRRPSSPCTARCARCGHGRERRHPREGREGSEAAHASRYSAHQQSSPKVVGSLSQCSATQSAELQAVPPHFSAGTVPAPPVPHPPFSSDVSRPASVADSFQRVQGWPKNRPNRIHSAKIACAPPPVSAAASTRQRHTGEEAGARTNFRYQHSVRNERKMLERPAQCPGTFSLQYRHSRLVRPAICARTRPRRGSHQSRAQLARPRENARYPRSS